MAKPYNKEVAARVAAAREDLPARPAPEGIIPLNSGYFFIERMRNSDNPKAPGADAKELRSV